MAEAAPTLIALHEAIQAHSNAMAEGNPDHVGTVIGSITIWEEITFESDGDDTRRVIYSATGQQGSVHALGLCMAAQTMLSEVHRD